MPQRLTRVPFTPEDVKVPAVQDFDCGHEIWQTEVSQWIKGVGPHSVLQDMVEDCDVYLYGTDQDGLVGFGSLAPARWQWPLSDSPRVNLIHIPNMAIQTRLQRRGFGREILEDLIADTQTRPGDYELLGLYVHPANAPAISLYADMGFEPFHRVWKHPETRTLYQSMLLRLR